MSSTLEERLKNNSSAFDGLLSLIPAKYYYDDDTQEQWKAKKKSKEEIRQNKRAKLDPSSIEENEKGASASQVLKKRALNATSVVIPGQRKQVQDSENREEEDVEDDDPEDLDQGMDIDSDLASSDRDEPTPKANGHGKDAKKQREDSDDDEDSIDIVFDDEGNEIPAFTTTNNKVEAPVPSRKEQDKAKKVPKELTPEEKRRKEEQLKALKEKLANKINILKGKRKAPGSKVAGAPQSREAILEERRKKAEQKAERKRKLAELEKDDDSDEEEEDDDDNEDEEEDDSDTEKDDGMSADGVLYQNIQFDDKTKSTSDLSNIRKAPKKKGPAKKDLRAHLKLLEAKKSKLNHLDPEKKKEIEEKEKWNRTIAHAEGTKLRDDERLLKKALKRKEAQKRKSEIEWRDRKEHVESTISQKQKRREENLQIRKDNKGVKRKNQQKQKRKFKSTIAPKRAGFEGRMRSGKKN